MAGPIHYEVYVRRTALAPWSLLIATEGRKHALETAEDQLSERLAIAVRVTKETLDPETMAFSSLTILNLGAPEPKAKKTVEEAPRPACSSPAELYTPHARALIGRVLEDWLRRQGVTAFELLHRPDLVEKLDASGVELQHAIQKVAVPESQATGQDVHAMVRHYQRLAEQAVGRVVKAGRDGVFADLRERSVADVAHRLTGSSDRSFAIGGAIAGLLRTARSPRERLDVLMQLMDAAPGEGPPRALVMVAVEQISAEMLAVRSTLSEIVGPSLDHGAGLAAVVRMVAPREVDILIAQDPRMALLTPAVEGAAARLADHLAAGEFPLLSAALARMVLRELSGVRRLRPNDPVGEIEILRILALTLTAAASRLLTLEEVQAAFIERSKSLVTADFVGAYVADCATPLSEAERLVRLCENVTGGANKRAAARWLSACVTSLRFETELRQGGGGSSDGAPGGVSASPSQRLASLARLQRAISTAQLGPHDEEKIIAALGATGAALEADIGLIAQIGRAQAPVSQRLAALLKLATGDAAPAGQVVVRARAEAARLLRAPDTREALAAAPESLIVLKGLMQDAGLAA